MSCILYDFTICAANCQPLCANVCAGKTNRKEGVRTSADSGEIGIRILASRRRSVRLGSDVPKGTSFTTEPVRIPFAKRKRGIRILAARRCSVRLGSDSLAAARSHSGSDSRLRLSFIALVPLRYTGASFTTAPFDPPLQKTIPPSGGCVFWWKRGGSNP